MEISEEAKENFHCGMSLCRIYPHKDGTFLVEYGGTSYFKVSYQLSRIDDYDPDMSNLYDSAGHRLGQLWNLGNIHKAISEEIPELPKELRP